MNHATRYYRCVLKPRFVTTEAVERSHGKDTNLERYELFTKYSQLESFRLFANCETETPVE